ncbi:hypothetical protein SCP_1402290 [Sparassis crispa]|uniref:Uncharacterized protein n=1 Tax=Sparassis crispa TaxID=139825 RepID=A0A401H345_9APHY|nr:hypothetical protein SCP_1402290 [Sparassis crispa]GBE88822.1 hypothetical protein SCP_1402290 [Sparassis crispa]
MASWMRVPEFICIRSVGAFSAKILSGSSTLGLSGIGSLSANTCLVISQTPLATSTVSSVGPTTLSARCKIFGPTAVASHMYYSAAICHDSTSTSWFPWDSHAKAKH